MSTRDQLRVLLADDHAIMRAGLRSLLEREPDIRVIAEASDGREAVALAEEHKPEIVVMDIAMPELNGVEATRRIIEAAPGVHVVALSMHSDKRFAATMLEAGAHGFIVKDCAFDELVSAMRAIARGGRYISPTISGAGADGVGGRRTPEAADVYHLLTAREREVLQLMAEGSSTRKIAQTLGVSPKTVETHRRQIMEKLGIHTVAELTKYALREGLISLDG